MIDVSQSDDLFIALEPVLGPEGPSWEAHCLNYNLMCFGETMPDAVDAMIGIIEELREDQTTRYVLLGCVASSDVWSKAREPGKVALIRIPMHFLARPKCIN